ncbi:NADP-dependent oxidoreductase [Ginsengibacter hankyongi]|uniref:NADP-dependent oxidoreductase n=1 Tax=Ginsengibacter hankyongi TaxID=2607284 RepID=A0A5J5IGP3_9BACT|nr:NADP-dependent oxidoreductase [Ginsengibacter hankyongi]KAA9037576.1 NADP-dependent oxidoreductase [Ginsengibacter hankyongi]
MKAIQIHEFGGPEVLKYEDAPKPTPAEDEVLIKVFASGVNPIDWKIRAGHATGKFPVQFPLIPGWDVSGEIEEVGGSIKNFRKGDEVYSRPDPSKNGSYAEYVVVKANLVNLKPKSISHEKAAAVPLAGLTAWQALFDYGRLMKDQKVLIHAASGGVGTFAVQFAKWKGAYVIGTTSGKNIDFVEDLGADVVIDYKKEKFEDILKDIDLVIDLIGGDTQKRSLKVLKSGGRLITTVQPENEEAAKEKNIHIESFLAKSIPEKLEQIKQLIDSGKVKPVIAVIMPLKDAAKAQQLSEEGHTRGKIVLQVA